MYKYIESLFNSCVVEGGRSFRPRRASRFCCGEVFCYESVSMRHSRAVKILACISESESDGQIAKSDVQATIKLLCAIIVVGWLRRWRRRRRRWWTTTTTERGVQCVHCTVQCSHRAAAAAGVLNWAQTAHGSVLCVPRRPACVRERARLCGAAAAAGSGSPIRMVAVALGRSGWLAGMVVHEVGNGDERTPAAAGDDTARSHKKGGQESS
jgi:hypothetical protein